MSSRTRFIAITVLFVALTGCHSPFFGKAKPDPAPLPVPARPVGAKAPPPKVEPPGPPPGIESSAPEIPPAVGVIPTPPAPKPKDRRQPRKPAAPSTTAQTPQQTLKETPPPAAGTGETTVPPSNTNVPKLGEILTEEQRLQYLRLCDESLSRAREALGQLRGLTLSPDQKQSLARVTNFISQAEQARQKDPQTAKQLAERADLLSRDLVRTVR